MTMRPAKPDSMSWMVLYLTVANVEDSVEFYHEVFGFEVLSVAEDDEGMICHAELKYKDIVIMCGQEGAFESEVKTPAHGDFLPPVSLYLYCDDVDQMFEACKAGEAAILSEPEVGFWGDKFFRVVDPDGHEWSFATNVADHE